MIDLAVVDLSRLQFALTALYHFLFVPLTLGLSFMLVIMESIYVMTRRPIWRTITRFWGTLFGINFVLGVATGITMEFQFGMNWSYYSHYVGDIFGAPLAIEGLMAFFLEATFVGLMFFGWDKLKPDMVKLYTSNFDEKELKELIRFYESPLGQKVLQKMPMLTAQSAQITQGKLETAVPEVNKLLADMSNELGLPKQP